MHFPALSILFQVTLSQKTKPLTIYRKKLYSKCTEGIQHFSSHTNHSKHFVLQPHLHYHTHKRAHIYAPINRFEGNLGLSDIDMWWEEAGIKPSTFGL